MTPTHPRDGETKPVVGGGVWATPGRTLGTWPTALERERARRVLAGAETEPIEVQLARQTTRSPPAGETTRSPPAGATTEEAPPPYQDSADYACTCTAASASAQHSSRTQNRATVSKLPLGSPCRGWNYAGGLQDHLVPTPERNRATIWNGCRRLASRAYTDIAKKTGNYTGISASSHYNDESGVEIPFHVLDGIQPGEVERRVTSKYDWTEDWDWFLTFH